MRKKINLQNSVTKSRIILLLYCLATLFMGIGYAAINSVTFDIEGTAIAKAQDGVFITDVNYVSDNYANTDSSKINKYNQTMLNSSVTLSDTNPNSSITYEITIYNSTNNDYYFDKVDYLVGDTTYSNENITFSLNGLNQYDVLNGKNSIKFMITFYYKDNILPNNYTLNSYLNFKFELDTVNPTWSIASVSAQTAKTTDTFSIKIIGTDNYSGVTSNLSKSNISYLVNGVASSPIDSSLELISSNEDQIVYELKITMLGGSGNLKINIDGGTLTDKSNNNSLDLLLDTGVNIVKNGDVKILIWKDYDSRFYNSIANYYSNITVDSSLSTDNIIANNYDLVVYLYPYWTIPISANILFDAGINLIMQGNDPTDDLYINASNDYYNYIGDNNHVSIQINKIVSNNLTKYLPNSFIEEDNNSFLWHFNSDAKVLYQATYDGVNYDKIGYLKRNNATWFHIAAPYNFGNGYVPIIEFVQGNLAE